MERLFLMAGRAGGLGSPWKPGNLDKVAEEREDRWMDEWLKTDVFFENLGKTYGLRTSDSRFY